MKEKLQVELHKLLEQADEKLLKMLYASAKVYLGESKKEVEKESLHRMVYISDRSAFCSDDDIQNILQASRKNNPQQNITGLLLHTDMRFLQILEGTQDQIKSTYDRIQKDKRHKNSVIKYFEPVKERYFSDWHMGSKNISNEELDFDTTISPQEKAIFQKMLSGERSSYEDKSLKELKTFMILS